MATSIIASCSRVGLAIRPQWSTRPEPPGLRAARTCSTAVARRLQHRSASAGRCSRICAFRDNTQPTVKREGACEAEHCTPHSHCSPQADVNSGLASSSSEGDSLELLSLATIAAMGALLGAPDAAMAVEDSVSSNGGGGAMNAAGWAYGVLVGGFIIRGLVRRAKKSKDQRLAREASDEVPKRWGELLFPSPTEEQERNATPLTALYGAAQAAFFFVVMWNLTNGVNVFFETRLVPQGDLAFKISDSVRQIVIGLFYLLTFLFGANTLGLIALAVVLVVNPDSVNQIPEEEEVKEVDPLDRIRPSDDLETIRAAYRQSLESAGKPTAEYMPTNISKKQFKKPMQLSERIKLDKIKALQEEMQAVQEAKRDVSSR